MAISMWFAMIMWASCSLKVQAANLKEKIPIELQELSEDVLRLEADLQRKKDEKDEGKPSQDLISQYFVRECSQFGVTAQDAMHDTASCRAPGFAIPSRSDVAIREDYNVFAHGLAQMTAEHKWGGSGDEALGYTCSHQRAHHRIQARHTMEGFGAKSAADALRKRDCLCYGDPDGPCWQYVHLGSHSDQFMDCVDAFYDGKNSDPKKTCQSASRTNFWVDKWCAIWGNIYYGTDFLFDGTDKDSLDRCERKA